MLRSNRPSVLGLVSIRQATSSVAFARRSSRSTPPSSRRADLHDLVAGHRHRRRVGAVRGVRRQHLRLVLAAVLVVGAREQQAGQLAVRAGARLERHVRQARDLRQRALQAPHQLERALRVLGVLERVQPGVAGQRRHPLVQLRVVLHRARAERVEALVQVEVLRRQRHVVAHQLGLARPRAARPGRSRTCDAGSSSATGTSGTSGRGRRESAPPRARALEDRHRLVARSSLTRPPPPARRRGAASRSMSSRVRRSVIATSRPSSYSG